MPSLSKTNDLTHLDQPVVPKILEMDKQRSTLHGNDSSLLSLSNFAHQ